MEGVRNELVSLNVGGTLFTTTLTTLGQYRGTSTLAAMFDPESGRTPAMRDANGAFFIDRDPKAFAAILSYLRTGELFQSYPDATMEEVLCEAEYFGLQGLVTKIRSLSPRHQHVILIYLAEGLQNKP